MQEKKILPRRKGVVLLSVLGCLFVFFAKTEKDLASAGNILWTAGYIGSTLLWTVVLGCLLGFLGTWVVHRLWNRAQTAEDTGTKQAAWYARISAWLQRRSGVQIFFGSLLFLLLAWLPVYLAYYPGICAYDAPVQTGQIMEHYYFDHHPIVHTLFLQGMLWLGSHIFGSVNAGMAFYTAVQMLLLSGSMAYGMLVHECQHDQGHGIQCIFAVAAGQSRRSAVGRPQCLAARDPGSAVCPGNRGDDLIP